jgi:hypothetical protein
MMETPDHKHYHENGGGPRKTGWETCRECTYADIYGDDIEAKLTVEREIFEYLYAGDRTGWTGEDIEAIAELAWDYVWHVPVEDGYAWAAAVDRGTAEYYEGHPEVLSRVLGESA